MSKKNEKIKIYRGKLALLLVVLINSFGVQVRHRYTCREARAPGYLPYPVFLMPSQKYFPPYLWERGLTFFRLFRSESCTLSPVTWYWLLVWHCPTAAKCQSYLQTSFPGRTGYLYAPHLHTLQFFHIRNYCNSKFSGYQTSNYLIFFDLINKFLPLIPSKEAEKARNGIQTERFPAHISSKMMMPDPVSGKVQAFVGIPVV